MAFEKRSSGILCPIFSLTSSEGIGTLGKGAYEFIDFLAETKQTYWQVLPIGVTSYGDSPYQSFSSYAGNPYFIDLELLQKEGLLQQEDLDIEWGDKNYINYELLWQKKYHILKKAFHNAVFAEIQAQEAYDQFPWLKDYALFMALKGKNDNQSRLQWKEFSVKSSEIEMKTITKELEKEIYFQTFMQVKFYEQWFELKKYANQLNICIIGDLPIFVAEDSVDVWANSKYFLLDQKGLPISVAGVPPDYFSKTGQLWGNPCYDWDEMKKDGFSWWIERIQRSCDLFDVLRIDHFRGFESYWSIPYGEETAMNGQWIKAPGQELFDLLKEQMGNLPIIAEDLGIITPAVEALITHTGFLRMSVLQFAFDHHADNPYKPENIKKDRVVYTGTHDNNTTIGWMHDPQNKENVENILHRWHKHDLSPEEFVASFIEMAWACAGNIAIIPIQDLLALGSEARVNTPSMLGDNWKWRMTQFPDQEKKTWLKELTEKYHRS